VRFLLLATKSVVNNIGNVLLMSPTREMLHIDEWRYILRLLYSSIVVTWCRWSLGELSR